MGGPWEKYQSPELEGPWAKYATPTKRSYSAMEVPGNAIMNLPDSARNFATGMVTAVQHPRESITAIRDIVSGAVFKGLDRPTQLAVGEALNNPEGVKTAIAAASAAGGVLKERYGGWDRIKRTFAEDPVGFLADWTTLISPAQGPIRAGAQALQGSTRAGLAGAATRTAGHLVRATMTPDLLTAPMNVLDAAGRGVGRAAEYTYNTIMDPKGATYRRAIGDRGEDVLQRLNTPVEIVPGSMPTAAEAASEAGATRFSAMGEKAREALPDEYQQRTREQNEARLTQVRQVGQTPAALQAAEARRAATSTRNYAVSDPVMIPRDAAFTRLVRERPAIATAIREARRIAADNGERLFDRGGNLTGRGAHLIKLALDDLIDPNPTTAPARNARNGVMTARQAFIDWVEARNPAYATARTTHARMSVPINQMEVGQYLERRLAPILDEDVNLRTSQYGTALTDARNTVRRSTGQPRFEQLEDILTPAQMQRVNSVYDDLVRQRRTLQDARAATGSGPNPMRVGEEVLGDIRAPNLINLTTSAANKLVGLAQGRISRQMAIEIATEMLDPRLAAESLTAAMGRRNNLINRAGRVVADDARIISRGVLHQPAIYNVLSPDQQEQRKNMLSGPR